MSASKEFIEYIMELLEPVAAIEGSIFFGGYGIKNNSTQFAMIMGNSLYFVVDDTTRPKFEKLNMKPFSYKTKNGIRQVKRYFEVPDELFEDREKLLVWARESIAVAKSPRKMTTLKSIKNPQVAAVFDAYPNEVRKKLLFLRKLIFDVASKTEGVGELEETLKWQQPSYLTPHSKSGSLIRIDQLNSQEGKYAMYFHCQTTLIDTFKEMYRDKFKFEGNRSIIFGVNDNIPVSELCHCISIALTYHRNKQRLANHSSR